MLQCTKFNFKTTRKKGCDQISSHNTVLENVFLKKILYLIFLSHYMNFSMEYLQAVLIGHSEFNEIEW